MLHFTSRLFAHVLASFPDSTSQLAFFFAVNAGTEAGNEAVFVSHEISFVP